MNSLDLIRQFVNATSHAARVIDVWSCECWVQSWSDTSLGFGGIAGQAFTDALVSVFETQDGDHAVFVGGSYAYIVKRDDPRFADFMKRKEQKRILGAVEWQRSCKHVLLENSNVCKFCQRGQPLPPARKK